MFKKLFFLVAVLASLAVADAFSDGFEAGFKAGYCYQDFGCIAPIPPIPPIPRIGEDDFVGGFSRGFFLGLQIKAQSGY